MNEAVDNVRRPVRAGAHAAVPLKAEYDQVNPLILATFCAYIVTWFLQLGNRIDFLGQIRFEFILALSLIVISLVVKRQPSQTKIGLYGWLAWFFVVLVIQIPFSANVEYSWTVFVDRVVKFAFMCVFISLFVRSPTALRWFLVALLLAWFKMGQEGFIGQITGSKVWENQGIMRLHGSTNLYLHPNSFSGFALGTVPFIYYLLPVAEKWWQKLFLLVLMLFALNIILNTGSRTGYIGFLAFLLLVFFRARHKFKVAIGLVVLATAVVPFIPEQYIGRFESIAGKEKEGNSKAVRIEILQDAATIFAEHPFGVGVSAFPTVREQRFGRTQDTHNLYLEVLTNLGIQGFIVWALMVVAIFRTARRISKGIDEQLARLSGVPPDADSPALVQHAGDLKLMRAILSAVSAYVFLRLVVGLFGMDLYEIYWWFALGLVLAIHNMSQVAARITDKLLAGKGGPEPAVVPGGRPLISPNRVAHT